MSRIPDIEAADKGSSLSPFSCFPAPVPSHSVPGNLYTHGTLLDPTEATVISDSLLIEEEGVILYAGPYDRALEEEGRAKGFVVKECGGKTILPSLVDAHVHLSSAVNSNVDPGPEYRLEKAVENIRLARSNGITHLRDCGDWDCLIATSAKRLRDEEHIKLASPGRPITIPKGHLNHLGVLAQTEAEVRDAVDFLADEGADFIKVCASGGFMTAESDPSAAQYTARELSAAVEQAAKYSKKVVAHAHSLSAIKNCVEAGVHSVEHGTFLSANGTFKVDEALLERMAEKGTYLVGTLLQSSHNLSKIEHTKDPYLGTLRRVFRKAIELGVNFCLATDAWGKGNPFGFFHKMLYSAVKWHGLTPLECLKAVTVTARGAPGLEGLRAKQGESRLSFSNRARRVPLERGLTKGPLAVGEPADFIVLEGEPFSAYAKDGRVESLLIDGRDDGVKE